MSDIYRPKFRPSRRVRPIRQRIGELVWKPDTISERLEAWEWNHPVASGLLTLAVYMIALAAFVLIGVAVAA